MGKLYYADEIGEMVDSKLDKMAKEIVMNTRLEGEDLLNAVKEFRVLQANLYSFVMDLKDADAAYEAEMAARKAKQEAEGNV